MNTPKSQKVQFGVFEVDLATGELRKAGTKVKLQDQPFQILSALLERPGEIVSREDLRQKIWRDDTFIDFDQGLNKAVNKIRAALGDSADSPRFVETVARRGYRFIADVAVVDFEPASRDPRPPPTAGDPPTVDAGKLRDVAAQTTQVTRWEWQRTFTIVACGLALV